MKPHLKPVVALRGMVLSAIILYLWCAAVQENCDRPKGPLDGIHHSGAPDGGQSRAGQL
jgi:hypothetical protein